MTAVRVNIAVPADLIGEVRRARLPVSAICQRALREALEAAAGTAAGDGVSGAPRVTWRLFPPASVSPDGTPEGTPEDESSLLPRYGDTRAVWVLQVNTESTPDGNGEVTIDYMLAG